MINLRLFNDCPFYIYSLCIEDKHNELLLRKLQKRIYSSYHEYMINVNSLEKIQKSIFKSKFIRSHLIYLYERPNTEVKELKKRILNFQPEEVAGLCWYCGIGEPDTLDHYLPKGKFPEFSILTLNLIPCCSTCNRNKDEEHIVAGHRSCFNMYFDNPLQESPLRVYFYINNQSLRFRFYIDEDIIGIRHIINHYKTLKLIPRYQRYCSTFFISTIKVLITRKYSKTKLKNYLLRKAMEEISSQSIHSWRAIMYKEMAKSETFLNYILYNYI